MEKGNRLLGVGCWPSEHLAVIVEKKKEGRRKEKGVTLNYFVVGEWKGGFGGRRI